MLILSVRTDKPEAEIGLFEDKQKLDYITWEAGRELSNTLHKQMDRLLKRNQKKWTDIQGIVCYKGPGSFTGLRIGLSAANALAYANERPIISVSGFNWQSVAISQLLNGEDEKVALPEYGGVVKTTISNK